MRGAMRALCDRRARRTGIVRPCRSRCRQRRVRGNRPVGTEPDRIRRSRSASKEVATGLVSPVQLVQAPGKHGRRFIVDQVGLIWGLNPAGHLMPHPFLDISSKITPLSPDYDERGLLGLAFHPDFAHNGRFFVHYTAPLRPGAPAGYDNTVTIAEFRAKAANRSARTLRRSASSCRSTIRSPTTTAAPSPSDQTVTSTSPSATAVPETTTNSATWRTGMRRTRAATVRTSPQSAWQHPPHRRGPRLAVRDPGRQPVRRPGRARPRSGHTASATPTGSPSTWAATMRCSRRTPDRSSGRR